MNIRSFYWYSLRIVWFPFWWEIRNLYIEYLKNTLLEKWYNEWHFTDFLNKEWVDIMCNNILNIKSKIYSINSISKNWWKKEYFLAPTHEISVSQALSRYIKYENDLPLKLIYDLLLGSNIILYFLFHYQREIHIFNVIVYRKILIF